MQSRWKLATFACLVSLSAFAKAAVAGEAKGFAISWFNIAQYLDPQGRDCPDGVNPNPREYYRRELQRLGYAPADVDAYIKDFLNPKNIPTVEMRGRIDGKPVDVYANPTSVPDPHLKTVAGPFGYGFNLDGQDKPGDFTDPETGERGVDNQLYRATGCIAVLRKPTPNGRPILPTSLWNIIFEQMPAWLIEIKGLNDPQNDDDVTVGIYSALEPLTKDGKDNAKSDMTFRVDPNPRTQNLVHGRVRDGVLTTDTFDLNMIGDPVLLEEYHWRQARLRLKINPDGSLRGVLGGYHAWFPFYFQYGAAGWGIEATNNIDLPGFYYTLKRLADAFPDPKTGENTAISAAYEIEAVPAFVVHENEPASIAGLNGHGEKPVQR